MVIRKATFLTRVKPKNNMSCEMDMFQQISLAFVLSRDSS